MINRRFTAPVLELPVPPEDLDIEVRSYLDKLRRALLDHLQRTATPGIFPVHEIDLVQPLRSGYGVPIGAVYVDASGVLRMKQSGELWAPHSVVTVQSGGAWIE